MQADAKLKKELLARGHGKYTELEDEKVGAISPQLLNHLFLFLLIRSHKTILLYPPHTYCIHLTS